MASTTSSLTNDAKQSIFSFSANDARGSISDTGAYVKEDVSAGKLDGLDFCAQNSLYDKDVRDVIESSIERPHLGVAKQYNSEVLPTDKAYFFAQGPEMRAIYILLFTPKTRFLLFEGSHDKKIPGKVMSIFGLLTLPHEKMRIEGITRVPHDMTNGGFALIDGRVGWTLLGGQEVAIGYASEAEIVEWGTYELGDTTLLREKVAELNGNGIKVAKNAYGLAGAE